jgi:hypothetical protein
VTHHSRRRVLLAAGASLGLGLLAGCAASGPGDDATSPTARDSPTLTPDAAGTDEVDSEPMDRAPASPAEVDERTHQFVQRLVDQEFEWAAGMFGGVLGGVGAGRLASTWRGLTIQHGPYERHEITGRAVQDDRSLRAVSLRFATDSQRLSLVFSPYARIVGVDFPTRDARPPSVAEHRLFDVTLDRDGEDDCPLGATITLPPGDDPVPGVVIVHRSGPLDRDGTVGPNRPYRDLAAGLAAGGVATIRYDKRSLVCDLARDEQTLANVVVADAVAAAARLATVERVSDVVVFGHGMGGVAAPLVARDADVAGLVLAATPARPLPAVLLGTERRKAAADGRITVAERQRLDFFAEKLNGTADLGPDDDYYVLGTATTFWRDLHAHDVVAAVRERPEPTLALHAGRSFVTNHEDLQRWGEVVPRDAIHVYPALDHLFMRVFDGSLPEAYFFPDTVATRVVDDVASWVDTVVG